MSYCILSLFARIIKVVKKIWAVSTFVYYWFSNTEYWPVDFQKQDKVHLLVNQERELFIHVLKKSAGVWLNLLNLFHSQYKDHNTYVIIK